MLKSKVPAETPGYFPPGFDPRKLLVITTHDGMRFDLNDPEQRKAYYRHEDEYDYLDDLPVKDAVTLNPDIFNHGYSGSFYMLYAAICSRVDVGECFAATQRMMADIARMSLYTARLYIPTLSKDGWIERVRKYDGWSPAAYKRLK